MAQIMRLLAGLLFMLFVATLALMRLQVEPAKPVEELCGDNFGACNDDVKDTRDVTTSHPRRQR